MAVYTLVVNTTGGAGVAAGIAQTEFPIRGFLDGMKFEYHASAPATTDVVVTEVGGLGQTLRTRTNANSNVTRYSAHNFEDQTGTAITGSYERFYIQGKIKVDVAQCDALSPALTVTISIIEDQLEI